MKKQRCKVCNNSFKIVLTRVYQVAEQLELSAMFTRSAKTLDAIDCPICGCQMILNERLPKLQINEEVRYEQAD